MHWELTTPVYATSQPNINTLTMCQSPLQLLKNTLPNQRKLRFNIHYNATALPIAHKL